MPTPIELMTDDACEATYRGAVLREGKEGVRSGLKAMFPQNRGEILESKEFGDTVVLHESVARASDGEKFEVLANLCWPSISMLAIYSFDGDKVSRVEFIR